MTRSSLLPRAALVLLALALAAWFVLGLRAQHYADAAASFAARADPGRPADVRRLERLYAKAESWSADPAPGIGQASLDLERGRTAPAISSLEELARSNPGNLQVRLLLVRTLAQRNDVAGVNRYAGQLRALFGSVGSTSPELTIRDGRGRLVPVVTDWVESRLESARLTPGALILAGWALSRSARAPADRILVFSGGRLLASAPLSIPRPDVSRSAGLPPGRYGFSVSVTPATPVADVQAFAVQGGLATAIPLPPR